MGVFPENIEFAKIFSVIFLTSIAGRQLITLIYSNKFQKSIIFAKVQLSSIPMLLATSTITFANFTKNSH